MRKLNVDGLWNQNNALKVGISDFCKFSLHFTTNKVTKNSSRANFQNISRLLNYCFWPVFSLPYLAINYFLIHLIITIDCCSSVALCIANTLDVYLKFNLSVRMVSSSQMQYFPLTLIWVGCLGVCFAMEGGGRG